MVSETKSKKQTSVLGYWSSLGIQERLMFVMTVGLIVSAFFLGYFYGQLQVLNGRGLANNPTNDAPNNPSQPSAQAPTQPTTVSDDVWKEIISNPIASEGSEKAEVVMVEFTDFQCPFCKRHIDQTAAQIEKDYIKTGKVRHIVRDLPLSFHANAHVAAEAARCANDQKKHKDMYNKLFATQEEWSNLADPKAKFGEYAGQLGMNVNNFNSCVSSGKHKAAVDADMTLAGKAGASGTPTFIINKQILVGAQPFTAFQTAINAAL